MLLVTLDGVRFDSTGAGGGTLTPVLDRLVSRGTSFSRAYAPAPATQPALATILTGLEPPTHGVRDDGDFVLDPELTTVAERLRAEGFTTVAGRESALTDVRFGLHQGFDTVVGATEPDPVFADEAPAPSPTAALATLLPALPDRTFVWLHLGGDAWPYAEVPYEDRVGALDVALGTILDGWDARFGDRSAIVVTSTHGTSLGDGGERTHGLLLHDASLRVPLVVRGGGDLGPPGTRVGTPVGLGDVAGTLLAAAGVPSDLRALSERPEPRPVWCESHVGRHVFGLAPLAGFADESGRYVEGAWAERCAVDGGACAPVEGGPDAEALRALRASLPDSVPIHAALEPLILEALARLGYVGGDPAAEPGTLDPRDAIEVMPLAQQARRSLAAGFTLEASQALVALDQRLPDAFSVRSLEGQILWHQGRLSDAERHWNGLFSHTPSGTVALELGAVYTAQAHWAEAIRWYGEARRLDPTSREALSGRLRALYESGERELADELSLRSLSTADDRGELAPLRADLLVDQQQLGAALEEAERGVARLPWSGWARMARARVHWERGEMDEALVDARRAVELDPYTAVLRMRLGTLLMELGSHAEAVRVLAPAARMLSDDEAVQTLYERALTSMTDSEAVDRRIQRAHGPG